MELKIFWLKPAKKGLENIFEFYESRARERGAEKIINKILSTVYGLGKKPVYLSVKKKKIFCTGTKISGTWSVKTTK